MEWNQDFVNPVLRKFFYFSNIPLMCRRWKALFVHVCFKVCLIFWIVLSLIWKKSAVLNGYLMKKVKKYFCRFGLKIKKAPFRGAAQRWKPLFLGVGKLLPTSKNENLASSGIFYCEAKRFWGTRQKSLISCWVRFLFWSICSTSAVLATNVKP